jgi:hypothetical protein
MVNSGTNVRWQLAAFYAREMCIRLAHAHDITGTGSHFAGKCRRYATWRYTVLDVDAKFSIRQPG